mmetsp:Transcript_29612/g.46502  ORF Transcript_29612/g.46502 Transcript_29612/m.46502 type:complete len:733 (+) Transcript_29612:85-2283(+)
MAADDQNNSAAAAAADGGGENDEQHVPPPPPMTFSSILNWLLFFFVVQTLSQNVLKRVFPPPSSNNNAVNVNNNNMMPAAATGVDSYNDATTIVGQQKKPLGATNNNPTDNKKFTAQGVKKMHKQMKPACLWQQGTMMDLDVVLSDSSDVPTDWPALTTNNDGEQEDTITNANANNNKATILARWTQQNLILGGTPHDPNSKASFLSIMMGSHTNQEMNRRNTTLHFPLTDAIWNNGTHVYAHVRLQRRVNKRKVRKEDVLVKRMVLTRHRKRKKMRDVKSLLEQGGSGSGSDNEDAADKVYDSSILTQASLNKTHDQLLLYIKPSLTIQFVELGTMDLPPRNNMPKQFSDHMDWYDGEQNEMEGNGWLYYPILYHSEFWISYRSLKEVNGTMKESVVDVTLEPVPMWKWQMQSGMVDNQRKQESFTGEEDDSNDFLRTMLLETNPYLLVVTAIVSVLHTVFDILAFKNDISFFKNKKSMEGLSLRSMIVNAAFSLVILLYLADNDTSFMVVASNGVGLVIEVWKISKAITIKWEDGKIEWVEAQSYTKSKTKEYDEIATSHLLFVTMPLVAGYGLYSLYFQKHKGWYSWILNTLVGFIYMFGFVMMTPQLFINYKLQSVAHLNWRTMSYKSINTFIDDLFAFVITMPIMHRMACLRDDVIFFIFLYQRYKYRVDYTRVNEFGQCAQPTEEMLAEIEEESKTEIEAEADQTATAPVDSSGVRRRRGAREKRD